MRNENDGKKRARMSYAILIYFYRVVFFYELGAVISGHKFWLLE